eukprot:scaffold72823_cov63-Phaeocystis_antarctica.AAC.3
MGSARAPPPPWHAATLRREKGGTWRALARGRRSTSMDRPRWPGHPHPHLHRHARLHPHARNPHALPYSHPQGPQAHPQARVQAHSYKHGLCAAQRLREEPFGQQSSGGMKRDPQKLHTYESVRVEGGLRGAARFERTFALKILIKYCTARRIK